MTHKSIFADDLAENETMPEPKKQSIKNVRYTHDALIDIIISNPSVSQADLSREFGFTQTWMSIIINSDAFQERLAERKAELIDPALRASINDRLDAIARRSLDKIMDVLDRPGNMKVSDLVAIAKLGVGDKNTRAPGPQQENNLYVVNLPPAATNSNTWLHGAQGNTRGVVLEETKPDPGFTDIVENPKPKNALRILAPDEPRAPMDIIRQRVQVINTRNPDHGA